MSQGPSINYFSFLDLMCCTLGSSLLVLVLLSTGRGEPGVKRNFTAAVDLLLPGAGSKAPTVTVEALAEDGHRIEGDEPSIWSSLAPGKRGVFFAAAPGTRARAFRVAVEQEGLPAVVGTGTANRDEALATYRAALARFGVLRGLLNVSDHALQSWSFGGGGGAVSPEGFAAEVREYDPEFPVPTRDAPLSALFLRRFPVEAGRAEDARVLCYVVARLVDASAAGTPPAEPVVIRAADLYGPNGEPDAGPSGPVHRAFGYLRLRLGPSPAVRLPALTWQGPQGSEGPWSFDPDPKGGWPAASPASDVDAVQRIDLLTKSQPDRVAEGLAAGGLVWVATGLVRLTPLWLELSVTWGSVAPRRFVLAEADDRVRITHQGTTTRFEFIVRVTEGPSPGSEMLVFDRTSTDGPRAPGS